VNLNKNQKTHLRVGFSGFFLSGFFLSALFGVFGWFFNANPG
jgi:hypothetical protein